MNSPAQRRLACPAARHAQAGVGLIEILIAVLVLSIGLLGLAQLQMKSLATNNSAMARSMATMFSYSIIDAIRIDRTNIAVYNGTIVVADSCPAAGKTLASEQLHQWCVSLAEHLGKAASTKGKITCNGTNIPTVCTVTITFDDSRAGVGGSDTQKVITTVAL